MQQAQLHEWCWDYGYSYPVSFRGRCFKHYYKGYVCKHIRHLFLNLVSYNRFVELEKEIQLPLTIFIKKLLLGTCTGISFADSTPLHVCRNQRILIHKTFEGLAFAGKYLWNLQTFQCSKHEEHTTELRSICCLELSFGIICLFYFAAL